MPKAGWRKTDGPRLIPHAGDETAGGVREGDDGVFLYAVWKQAHDFADESVWSSQAQLIADRIMDGVAVARREDPTFLADDHIRRAYVQRAVYNNAKTIWSSVGKQSRLRAMFAHIIETHTMARPFPAPDMVEAVALREREWNELMLCVSHAVAGLPDKCQEVVFLRYCEELWPRDIAKRLGIKPDSVHSHLKRALEPIKGAVRQYLIDHMPKAEQ